MNFVASENIILSFNKLKDTTLVKFLRFLDKIWDQNVLNLFSWPKTVQMIPYG